MKISLKYNFIFDPKEVWSSKEAFSEDLGKYFEEKGYVAEVIDTGIENAFEFTVFLDPKEGIFEEEKVEENG